MNPDRLNDEGAADRSLLFDDVRALDHLVLPDRDDPAPHPVGSGDCQLMDDIRAADRILRAEARLEKVSPAGHRSARSCAGLRNSRKRGVEPETGHRRENTNFVLGRPDHPGLRKSMTYSARGPPFRRTAAEALTRSSAGPDGYSEFNRRADLSSGEIAFVAGPVCHYIFLESPSHWSRDDPPS